MKLGFLLEKMKWILNKIEAVIFAWQTMPLILVQLFQKLAQNKTNIELRIIIKYVKSNFAKIISLVSNKSL